jgi:hypothetical protein
MSLKVIDFHDPQEGPGFMESLEKHYIGNYDARVIKFTTEDCYVVMDAEKNDRRVSLLWMHTYPETAEPPSYHGYRAIQYDDHYVVSIEGEVRGVSGDSGFEQAIDTLEQ